MSRDHFFHRWPSFSGAPARTRHLKVTDAISVKQQNPLNPHTPGCGCAPMPLPQSPRPLCHKLVLSLWDHVPCQQVWTRSTAAGGGTGRRTVLLGRGSCKLDPLAFVCASDKSRKARLLGNFLLIFTEQALSTSASGKFQACGPLCSLLNRPCFLMHSYPLLELSKFSLESPLPEAFLDFPLHIELRTSCFLSHQTDNTYQQFICSSVLNALWSLVDRNFYSYSPSS